MRPRLVVGAGLVTLVIAGSFAAVQADAPRSSAEDENSEGGCPTGEPPARGYGERPPEGSLRYSTPPVVIGCGRVESGPSYQLVAYRLGRGGRGSLCIDIHDPDTGESSGCGTNRVYRGGAIDATGMFWTRGRPARVTGATSGRVAGVAVRYEAGGRMQERPASLVVVRDADLLQRLAVKRAFGQYAAEVPRGARAVSVQARSAGGRVLGVSYFDGFPAPTGDGRACHGRPRVTGLRLLSPPQVRRRNSIRVSVRYPRGFIASVDVTTGRSAVHADLAPPEQNSPSERRAVTLPLTFQRRGTVGVDVTAEGIPQALKRCGDDGRPRDSATRTLVARVR